MSESFGTRLRRHRERRGVTVAEIAEQTKIKASLLEGLERDDVSQWPAGIFSRAYVRAYAVAIGFDADSAVREFVQLHPAPVVPVEVPAEPRGLRGLVASALGTLRKQPTSEPTSGFTPGSVVEDPAVSGPPPFSIAPPPAAVAPPKAQSSASGSAPALSTPAATDQAATAPAASATSSSAPRAASPTDARASDLLAAAKICTELGRVEQIGQVLPLLRDAAKILKAHGLIVWVWDAVGEQLRPAFVHGYAAKVRARLRGVSRDADNVTAAAFRAAAPLAKGGEEGTSSALAVPLLTPGGCGGVLAIEVAHGLEQDPVIRALATFFAAMLAQLIGPSPSEAPSDTVPDLVPLEAHPS
jgi:hypothetical protein